jgi:hypothetical protein
MPTKKQKAFKAKKPRGDAPQGKSKPIPPNNAGFPFKRTPPKK